VKKRKAEQELKFKSRGVLLYAFNNLYKTVGQASRLSRQGLDLSNPLKKY